MAPTWLTWMIAGALIGFLAARRRKWSEVAGLLGGALLGPFAFALFLVRGAGDAKPLGPQVGRGVLFAVLIVAIALVGLVLWFRAGGAR